MGRFISVDDLIDQFGAEVARFHPATTGDLDRRRVEARIAAIEAFVLSYLHAHREQTPRSHGTHASVSLPPWATPMVTRAVAALVRRDWHVHDVPASVEAQAGRAMSWLKAVAHPKPQAAVRHTRRPQTPVTEGF